MIQYHSCVPEGGERAGMNLPLHYTTTRFEEVSDFFDELRGESTSTLVAILEGASDDRRRYAAGVLLCYLGDPRFESVNPVMVPVPAALAVIGTSEAEIDALVARYASVGVERKWLDKEYPPHEVSVKSFALAKYPVTNIEYLRFLKETKHPSLPTSWVLGRYPVERANHPVFNVYPEDIQAYIRWISEKTGTSFRLPTEYEWELAARGVQRKEFPWGQAFDATCTNTVESNIISTTPVGLYASFGATEHGVCDMAGNVEEYVADLYRPYPGGQHVEDHLSADDRAYLVSRGGSFARFSDLARGARRHGLFPTVVRDIFPMGFRLAHD